MQRLKVSTESDIVRYTYKHIIILFTVYTDASLETVTPVRSNNYHFKWFMYKYGKIVLHAYAKSLNTDGIANKLHKLIKLQPI